MGHRYVFKLLLSEKSQDYKLKTTEAREK
jgi:hypothetical protein